MTTKENWNPDWDKVVKPDATPLKEAEGVPDLQAGLETILQENGIRGSDKETMYVSETYEIFMHDCKHLKLTIHQTSKEVPKCQRIN